MIPYVPEPTQTTESFRQHLPNTAGDRPLLVEQRVFVSLWSSFNRLLQNLPTGLVPVDSGFCTTQLQLDSEVVQ